MLYIQISLDLGHWIENDSFKILKISWKFNMFFFFQPPNVIIVCFHRILSIETYLASFRAMPLGCTTYN